MRRRIFGLRKSPNMAKSRQASTAETAQAICASTRANVSASPIGKPPKKATTKKADSAAAKLPFLANRRRECLKANTEAASIKAVAPK